MLKEYINCKYLLHVIYNRPGREQIYCVTIDPTTVTTDQKLREVEGRSSDAMALNLEDETLGGWRKRWEDGKAGWHKTVVNP